MTILQTILAAVNWDTRVNENFASVSPAAMYAFDPTSANLNLKIKGGFFGVTPISDYASTLTASSGNNYVVYARADGAISRATSTTNWNDDANYGRIGVANAGATTFAWTDSRTGPFVPPAGGTVSTVNGQSGTVVLDIGDINDVDLSGLANGDTLVWDSGTSTWIPGAGGGGSGTVTSVAYSFDASLSDIFSIGGSPITTSGTLTASAVDAGGHRLAGWDNSIDKFTYFNIGTNLTYDTATKTLNASGAGSGDVVGPSSSVADQIAVFNGTTGKIIKDGGKTIAALRVPNVQSVASASTVTPTFDNDAVKITAQAAALTLANPTGTAIDMAGLVIRVKDNGTARTIGYGTQYRAIGVTLPVTTVANKTTYIAAIYNSEDTRWDVVATGTEP